MPKKIILDLCGGTGSWSKPYKDNGYEVIVITLPDYSVTNYHIANGQITFYASSISDKGDIVLNLQDIYGILAAPPCTYFSIARNDKTAKEPRDLRKAMKLVTSCLNIIWECLYYPFRISENNLKFWAMENPNGYLKRFLGKPALDFHPYMYGDPYTKRTLIWGMFNEPKKNQVKPREFEHPTTKGAKDFVSCVEHFADLKQIPEGYLEKTGINKRATLRSMTPQGFAKAFFLANK